jgi:bifunctional DNA-binding transcriptional regulator/antitoxin component of YhaV-PrlF toxin-antitoxin module
MSYSKECTVDEGYRIYVKIPLLQAAGIPLGKRVRLCIQQIDDTIVAWNPAACGYKPKENVPLFHVCTNLVNRFSIPLEIRKDLGIGKKTKLTCMCVDHVLYFQKAEVTCDRCKKKIQPVREDVTLCMDCIFFIKTLNLEELEKAALG